MRIAVAREADSAEDRVAATPETVKKMMALGAEVVVDLPKARSFAVDGVVTLSTYGIGQPSQLGVRMRDDVKLHLDFTARPAAITSARLGGTR